MALENEQRMTQAERRARSRNAIVEAAARSFALRGYAGTSLNEVAREAGYTRGALYHQFAGKEALALAVIEWLDEVWTAEVGVVLDGTGDPAERLLAFARAHAVFCRRGVGAVLRVLRAVFTQEDHPVARIAAERITSIDRDCCTLIRAGRGDGSIPPGPPATVTAAALSGALEAIGVESTGSAPYDVELAERAVRGILGLAPNPGQA